MSFLARLLSLFGSVSVLFAVAAPVAAASPVRLVVDEIRMPSHAAAMLAGSVGISPPPCQDKAFNLIGGKQASTYKWSFKASSTPSGLNKNSVAQKLQKSFANITGAHNDCGRADKISATSQYLGTTSSAPNCNSRDGKNVVGFGSLNSGVLAVTCYWINSGKIIEADMKITTKETWALSLSTCHGDSPMLEATITHEAGHVFGMDHVGETKHGRLTMSPYLDGPCENNEATLGLGDMLGLESMY
ncbi:MAG TPA: hypothetical protein VH371_09265 [Candidatus Limnocylindrales bacterium]